MINQTQTGGQGTVFFLVLQGDEKRTMLIWLESVKTKSA